MLCEICGAEFHALFQSAPILVFEGFCHRTELDFTVLFGDFPIIAAQFCKINGILLFIGIEVLRLLLRLLILVRSLVAPAAGQKQRQRHDERRQKHPESLAHRFTLQFSSGNR